MEEALRSGVEPERVAFLTFTRAARAPGMDRARLKFNVPKVRLPYFRTLHSIAFKELDVTQAGLITTTDDLLPFGERNHLTFTPKDLFNIDRPFMSGGPLDGDGWLAFEHNRRHNLLTVAESGANWPPIGGESPESTPYLLRNLSREYEHWKEEEGLLDFTDLLERRHTPLPVDVVIVDEAQDLSRLQWRVLWEFAEQATHVYVAGDDDQSIFTWAGASPKAFLALKAHEVKVLDQSYRLPRKIHDLASRIVLPILDRHPKEWKPRPQEGVIKLMDSPESVDESLLIEMLQDTPGDWLILYRAHYQGEPVERRLRWYGVPYSRLGGMAAPGARWTPAILAWSKLHRGKHLTRAEAGYILGAIQPADRPDVKRSKLPPDAIGPDDLKVDHTVTWVDALTRIPLTHRIYLAKVLRLHGDAGLLEEPRIKLSTIHAAKGAEADNVLLVADLPRKSEAELLLNPDAERRVWYVGVRLTGRV